MRELTMTEVQEVSGGAAIIPEFPTGPGLSQGLATILAATGYSLAVLGTNAALGLNEILGVPNPRPV